MNGVERGFYNEKEIAHIEDVRDLVHNVRIFIGCCAVVFLVGTILLFRSMYGSAITRIGTWLAVLMVPFTVLSVVAVIKDFIRNKKESSGKSKDESTMERDSV